MNDEFYDKIETLLTIFCILKKKNYREEVKIENSRQKYYLKYKT